MRAATVKRKTNETDIEVAINLDGTGASAIATGIGIWAGLIGVFRMMAKADPQMSKVYLRQLNYAAYYPPRSRAARLD